MSVDVMLPVDADSYFEIISNLPPKELLNCSRVSKSWKMIIENKFPEIIVVRDNLQKIQITEKNIIETQASLSKAAYCHTLSQKVFNLFPKKYSFLSSPGKKIPVQVAQPRSVIAPLCWGSLIVSSIVSYAVESSYESLAFNGMLLTGATLGLSWGISKIANDKIPYIQQKANLLIRKLNKLESSTSELLTERD